LPYVKKRDREPTIVNYKNLYNVEEHLLMHYKIKDPNSKRKVKAKIKAAKQLVNRAAISVVNLIS
jgi:hypothetical protein